MTIRPPRAGAPLALLLLALGGCDDSTGIELVPGTTEVGIVLGSVDLSLTVFATDRPEVARTIGVAPDGSPVGLAVRGDLAVVPLGIVPAVAVVDIVAGAVVRTVPLPPGSGATGVAFLSDSVALVANPGRNSVSPVNVLRGTTGPEVAVGVFPQAIVVDGGRAFVLNGVLQDFVPAGNGTVTVLDASTLEFEATIQLGGTNPGSAAVGPGGRLYVVNSGTFFGNDGSLSVVDLTTLREVEHHAGFGDFPGSAALGPDGRLYVTSFQYGAAIWDPGSRGWVRGPLDAVTPGGTPSASGLGFDESGRLYSLMPECSGPAAAHRLDGAFAVERSIPVGICPIAIAFARVQAG